MSYDPIDEMVRVLSETLNANALTVTTSRGGYVGGGQPHGTVPIDAAALDALARGLLARQVKGPPAPLTECPHCPHWMELHNDDGSCGCGASHPVAEPTPREVNP